MATYTFISKYTIGSGGASDVTFSSIPSTYTDLIVQVSARSTESDNGSSLRFYFNGDTTNNSRLELRAIGSTVASYTIPYAQAGYVAASQTTSGSWGTATLYVPNYNSSNVKLSAGDISLASSTTGENYNVFNAGSWAVTNAITSITLLAAGGNWVQYSTFCLYGIKNS